MARLFCARRVSTPPMCRRRTWWMPAYAARRSPAGKNTRSGFRTRMRRRDSRCCIARRTFRLCSRIAGESQSQRCSRGTESIGSRSTELVRPCRIRGSRSSQNRPWQHRNLRSSRERRRHALGRACPHPCRPSSSCTQPTYNPRMKGRFFESRGPLGSPTLREESGTRKKAPN